MPDNKLRFCVRYPRQDHTELFDLSFLVSLTGPLFFLDGPRRSCMRSVTNNGHFQACTMQDERSWNDRDDPIASVRSRQVHDSFGTRRMRLEIASRPVGYLRGSGHGWRTRLPCPTMTNSVWKIPGKARCFQDMDAFARDWVGPGLSLTRCVLIGHGLCRRLRKSNSAQLTAVPSPLHHHPES